MKQINLAGRLRVSSVAMGCMRLDSAKEAPGRLPDITKGSEIELSREDWYDIYRSAGFRLP